MKKVSSAIDIAWGGGDSISFDRTVRVARNNDDGSLLISDRNGAVIMATELDWPRSRGSQSVALLLPGRIFGLVLIFAFAVKCCDRFFFERLYSDPLFVASAVLDLIFGCFLVLSSSSVMYIAGVTIFGTYFAFQLYSTFSGVVDCACMGNLKLPPAIWMTIDVSAISYFLSMLVFHLHDGRKAPVNAMQSLLLAIALCLAVAIANVLNPMEAALEQTSFVSTERIANSWCRIAISLQNRSGETIGVVGSKDTCACRMLRSQKIELAPGEEQELQLYVRVGEKDRFVEGTLPLFIRFSGMVKSFDLQFFARIRS